MPRKEKEVIWHKKRGKFFPPTVEKAGASAFRKESAQAVSDRQRFAEDLAQKVRQAVRQSSNDQSAL